MHLQFAKYKIQKFRVINHGTDIIEHKFYRGPIFFNITDLIDLTSGFCHLVQ